MTFPIINHIDDVLPSIAGRGEFVHAVKDGYSIIDYNFALADSFDDPMRLECRGIKFAPDGKILARPLQKFFNIGERPDTQPHLLDFSQPHVVTEKLDGSMIHPAIVNGEVVFMTRMGRTDVAVKAERHLNRSIEFACLCLMGTKNPATPIFEFTAPDNRIVVRYEESKLSLLAIRRNHDGHYYSAQTVDDWATDMQVDHVTHHPSDWNSSHAFLDYARAVTGREGFVVRFENGLWVKAKGEDYVLKHRAKDSVMQEKNVLALILRGELDDVLPLLEAEDREAIERYRTDVENGIVLNSHFIRSHVEAGATLDQKTFAVAHLATVAPERRALCFSVRAGNDAREAVRETLLRSVGSQSTVDATRHLHGAAWPL